MKNKQAKWKTNDLPAINCGSIQNRITNMAIMNPKTVINHTVESGSADIKVLKIMFMATHHVCHLVVSINISFVGY